MAAANVAVLVAVWALVWLYFCVKTLLKRAAVPGNSLRLEVAHAFTAWVILTVLPMTLYLAYLRIFL